jgi:hypothetical protein
LEKPPADCFTDVGVGKSKVIEPFSKFFIFAVVQALQADIRLEIQVKITPFFNPRCMRVLN